MIKVKLVSGHSGLTGWPLIECERIKSCPCLASATLPPHPYHSIRTFLYIARYIHPHHHRPHFCGQFVSVSMKYDRCESIAFMMMTTMILVVMTILMMTMILMMMMMTMILMVKILKRLPSPLTPDTKLACITPGYQPPPKLYSTNF